MPLPHIPADEVHWLSDASCPAIPEFPVSDHASCAASAAEQTAVPPKIVRISCRNKIHPDTPDARQDSSPSGDRHPSISQAVPVSIPLWLSSLPASIPVVPEAIRRRAVLSSAQAPVAPCVKDDIPLAPDETPADRHSGHFDIFVTLVQSSPTESAA